MSIFQKVKDGSMSIDEALLQSQETEQSAAQGKRGDADSSSESSGEDGAEEEDTKNFFTRVIVAKSRNLLEASTAFSKRVGDKTRKG